MKKARGRKGHGLFTLVAADTLESYSAAVNESIAS
jgi:hypothetical protein